jgi:hypothetical protein
MRDPRRTRLRAVPSSSAQRLKQGHCVCIAIDPGLSHGEQSLQIALLRVEQMQCAGFAEPDLIATDLDALFWAASPRFAARDTRGRLDRLERIRNVAKGTNHRAAILRRSSSSPASAAR